MKYESPIDLIYKDIQYHMEENIYTAVQNVGIHVDKDELIKALKYDRGQYEKGYADAKAERKKGEWIREQLALPLSDGSKECFRCSSCLTHWDNISNYCPYCGADMIGEKYNESNM